MPRKICIILLVFLSTALSLAFAFDNDENYCTMFNRYINKGSYRLPFRGKWKVFWGGCKKSDNLHHIKLAEQRFAYDFLKVDKKGNHYKKDGKKLTDYFSYNQPVLAPQDGYIIQIVDGIEDSPIGKPNKYFIPGNFIVIDHENGEFSFIAHLKKHSFLFKEGDYVKKGQMLGKVGNSGNSSMPHMHYHLGNAKYFQESQSLPISFRNLKVNGERKERYKPKKGELLESM